MNKPDKWVVIKITHNDETYYKVFGTWYGGYLDGDYWRLNSGITKVVETENDFEFFGQSGSVYVCKKSSYGTNGYSQSILNGMIEKAQSQNVKFEVLPEETVWVDLEY